MARAGDVTCTSCGQTVPAGRYCVVCGQTLADEIAKRRQFSAAPHQRAWTPAPLTTLFPALPRAEMHRFHAAAAAGTVLMVGLALFRLFPLALVVAAILVPLLTVMYVYDVDLYEDEPLRVVALTMLWGLVAGIVVTVLARAFVTTGTASLVERDTATTLVRGVVVPLVSLGAILIGPVVLLRYPRFNDALDGVTFGVATAVSFAGAQLLVQSSDFFATGLRPYGSISTWIVRVLELGLALPLLMAAVVGGACASLWLRYRSSVRDRAALGPVGRPSIAVPLAGAALVAAAFTQTTLTDWQLLPVLIVLDVAALIWLRRAVHLGLLQEAAEHPIEPPITCPNCGHDTPHHTFCIECGVSFQALPKERPQATPASPEEAPA
jgi:ribosomal protein L32